MHTKLPTLFLAHPVTLHIFQLKPIFQYFSPLVLRHTHFQPKLAILFLILDIYIKRVNYNKKVVETLTSSKLSFTTLGALANCILALSTNWLKLSAFKPPSRTTTTSLTSTHRCTWLHNQNPTVSKMI